MRSFQVKPTNRRAMYLALAGSVESQLRDAYAKRYRAKIDTQVSLANKLGVGRSVVNKRLRGMMNMAIETIADMAWALGYSVTIKIFDPNEHSSNEPFVVSEHATPPQSIRTATTVNDFEVKSFSVAGA